METKDFKPMIMMFLVITLGLAFITANANTIGSATLTYQLNNESISIAPARLAGLNNTNLTYQFTLSKAFNNTGETPITSFVWTNASGYVISAGNYSFDGATGRFNITNNNVFNTTAWGGNSNSTLASYVFEMPGYIDDSGTNAIMQLITLISIIGLLLAVIGYFNWDRIRDLMGR